MYRVILVEDEATVRQGIAQKIDWQAHGFILSGAYADGREALAAFKERSAHVVITDINMPFMDGLSLAEIIHELAPRTAVILLTGYDEFAYAQRAIEYKVHSYILKPITARQLLELLDRLHGELEEQDRAERNRQELAEAKGLVRRKVLVQLACDGFSPEVFQKNREAHAINLMWTRCCAGYFRILEAGKKSEIAAAALRAALDANLAGKAAEYFQDQPDRLLVLFSHDRNPEEYLSHIARHAIDSSGWSLSAVIGPVAETPGTLGASTRIAREAFSHLYRLPSKTLLPAAEILAGKASDFSTTELRRAIIGQVRMLETEESLKHLDHLIRALEGSGLSQEDCLRHLQKLMLLLGEEAGIEAEKSDAESSRDNLHELFLLPSLSLVHEYLRQYVRRLIDTARQQKNSVSRQAAQAIGYLQEHYADPTMSLGAMTTHLSVSTSYFSGLFKNYTGVTFVEYLTRLRMEKARELLLTTDLKNYEIAGQIGYDDPGYFSSAFKKYTGLKPSEFRKKREAGGPR